MLIDFIQNEKEEISSFIKENYKNAKFTVKFNGEFFIVNFHKDVSEYEITIDTRSISNQFIKENTIFLEPSDKWTKECISKIKESENHSTNITIYSQATRLEKQLEFGLASGNWNSSMYDLAKDILYLIHTKSKSIRLNIVKRCAKEYNRLQRQGDIPIELVEGYKNALCQIDL